MRKNQLLEQMQYHRYAVLPTELKHRNPTDEMRWPNRTDGNLRTNRTDCKITYVAD